MLHLVFLNYGLRDILPEMFYSIFRCFRIDICIEIGVENIAIWSAL